MSVLRYLILFSTFVEKSSDNLSTFIRQDARTHFRLMVQRGTSCDVEERFAGSCLCVCTSVHNTADSAHDDCAGAHWTWFDGNIQCHSRETPSTKTPAGTLNGNQFGVCRCIMLCFTQIVSTGDNFSRLIQNNGTDRNFAKRICALRLRQCQSHAIGIIRHGAVSPSYLKYQLSLDKTEIV